MKQQIQTKKHQLGIIVVCLAFVGQAGAQVIYNNDFQTAVGPEWSIGTRDTTPVGSRTFLGQFGNNTASLTLGGLVPHDSLTLSFDLFVIRTWDGNSFSPGAGPDIWSLGVSGGQTLLQTTFSNNESSPGFDRQSFPDMLGGGDHPAETGASEVDTLGYTIDYEAPLGVRAADSVYHFTFSLPHTANSVTFNFAGAGLEALSNESWGIDNVRIVAVPEPSTWALLMAAGALILVIRRERVRHAA